MVAAALITAAGSLLGGLFGRPKQKVISAGDNRYSDVEGIMRASKDFGFNPLTLLSQGSAIGPTVLTQDNSAFGAGIANAFALAGDAVTAKRSQTQKLNDYQTQNKRLTDKVNAITLRAPSPGVYGISKMPSDPDVYGASSDTSYASPQPAAGDSVNTGPAGGPYRALSETDPLDPRRGVDNKLVGSTSGVMVVDNPHLPKMWFPTIDGDEPVDILDLPSMAVAGPQIAYGFGDKMTLGGGRESRPAMSAAEAKAYSDRATLSTKRPKPRPKSFNANKRPNYDAGWIR